MVGTSRRPDSARSLALNPQRLRTRLLFNAKLLAGNLTPGKRVKTARPFNSNAGVVNC